MKRKDTRKEKRGTRKKELEEEKKDRKKETVPGFEPITVENYL